MSLIHGDICIVRAAGGVHIFISLKCDGRDARIGAAATGRAKGLLFVCGTGFMISIYQHVLLAVFVLLPPVSSAYLLWYCMCML